MDYNLEAHINSVMAEMDINFDGHPVFVESAAPPAPIFLETTKIDPALIADLAEHVELEKEKFGTQIVKMLFRLTYGKPLTESKYREWRSMIECPDRNWISADDAVKLIAIAKLKKLNPRKKHTETQIEVMASGKKHREETLNLLRIAQEQMILGKQLKARLYDRGILTTSAELRKLIPGFSPNRLYNFGKVALAIAQNGEYCL